MNLEELKKQCVVIDIETSSFWPGTQDPIDITTHFEDYVKFAKVKWFGAYSFATGKLLVDIAQGHEKQIAAFIESHDIIVGHNIEEFDLPILYNNNMMPVEKKFIIVDTMVILGARTFFKRDGTPFKGRGELMGIDFDSNSLRNMAKAFNLPIQKGDIDYQIFYKDEWTDEEIKEIVFYLEHDIQVTRLLFEKLWDFWHIFADFLPEHHVKNLSWIRNSIASLTYKSACHVIGKQDTYAEKKNKKKEDMGGRVIEPKLEELINAWLVDYSSLYPHMYAMFNLFAEQKDMNIWSSDKTILVFETKGRYNTKEWHPLSKAVAHYLEVRISIKKFLKEYKKNPLAPMPEILRPFVGDKNTIDAIPYLEKLAYALKIFLNSLYGASRSEVFEQIHTENCGWDCCWLGQQIHEYTEKELKYDGWETYAGDTDSLFVKHVNPLLNTEENLRACLDRIVARIKQAAPFPVDTFNLEIEPPLHYIMWPFSEHDEVDAEGNPIKEGRRNKKIRKAKKKNYLYIYGRGDDLQLKILGLPIIKSSATKLGPLILEETLKPEIMRWKRAKFPRAFINQTMQKYLARPECLEMLAVEFKVKPADSYKAQANGLPSNTIQAQVSRGYLSGQGGVVSLIKNKKIGNAGKGFKYCTVEEAVKHNLTIADLELEKLENELEPFVEWEQ